MNDGYKGRSDSCIYDWMAERGGGEVWWQAGSLGCSTGCRDADSFPRWMYYRNSMSLFCSCIDAMMTDPLGSAKEVNRYWQIAHYGGPLQERIPEEDKEILASLGLVEMSGGDQGRSEYNAMYDDDW